MGEIPEDVMRSAVNLVSAIKCAASGGTDAYIECARALLAERKRCADVAIRVAGECYGDTSAIGAAASIQLSILNQ